MNEFKYKCQEKQVQVQSISFTSILNRKHQKIYWNLLSQIPNILLIILMIKTKFEVRNYNTVK